MAKKTKNFSQMGAKYDSKLAAALEKARLVYEEKKRRIYAKFQADFAKKYATINPIQAAETVEDSAEIGAGGDAEKTKSPEGTTSVSDTNTGHNSDPLPLPGSELIVGTYENHNDFWADGYE